mmetsp:Transcript_49416/g.116145  ORF Transcript_49416/g.116145 Transcript_49416/m.116145 type:complete len:244 (-) Transcript_49416:1113-1844(-)
MSHTQRVQGSLNQPFRLVVQSRSCLVQDQDLWVLGQGACDGNSLPLTSRQHPASCADEGAKALWKPAQGVVDLRHLCGLDRSLVADGLVPGLDVEHGAASEQNGLLADVADQLAPGLHRDLPQMDSVDQNLSRAWVVESLDQLHDGALATSTLTSERNLLALLHPKAEVVQHPLLGPRRVSEADISELDAVDHAELLWHRRDAVERLLDGLSRGFGLHHLLHGFKRHDCSHHHWGVAAECAET